MPEILSSEWLGRCLTFASNRKQCVICNRTINPLLYLLCNRICQTIMETKHTDKMPIVLSEEKQYTHQQVVIRAASFTKCRFVAGFFLVYLFFFFRNAREAAHIFRMQVRLTYIFSGWWPIFISHTVFMYHFNEYFYRKGINLGSLAKWNKATTTTTRSEKRDQRTQ